MTSILRNTLLWCAATLFLVHPLVHQHALQSSAAGDTCISAKWPRGTCSECIHASKAAAVISAADLPDLQPLFALVVPPVSDGERADRVSLSSRAPPSAAS